MMKQITCSLLATILIIPASCFSQSLTPAPTASLPNPTPESEVSAQAISPLNPTETRAAKRFGMRRLLRLIQVG